jgi:hypothetical protein
VRLSIYAQLLGIASKSRRKRSWAESFFPTTSPRSSRGEDDEVESDDAETE